jgi:predicted ATPase
VVELAASHTAQPLPDGLGDRVHLLTEGNPLFVDEVMRLLGAQGALARPDALASRRLPVPAAVREAIGCRLEGLEAAVVDALEVAAVIGSEFRLDTLALSRSCPGRSGPTGSPTPS